jgi:NADH dehydrogenase FAD-containing subunit
VKRVVIAGGGVAGHRIAYALQKDADVTLIDPKDYLEVPMAAPRMLVEPRRAADAIIPFSAFLPRVAHMQGVVEAVQPHSIKVNGKALPFDYLVLATGSAYQDDLIKPHSGSAPGRREHFHQWADRLHRAQRVVIVGGGPVGVELAGEILEDQRGKQLTLIHNGPTILPALTRGPQRYAHSFLTNRGAEVLLNQTASDAQLVLSRVTTSSGDLVFHCAGYRIDTGYLRDFPAPVLDAAGRVLTDQYLRMAGTENIFVAGDITALPEPRLGIWAGKHAAVIIDNLRKLIRTTPASRTRLASYKPATGSRMMLVTLGRSHGTGHIPPVDFTNSWFARSVKSRDMFIGRYRKAIGLS